MESAQLKYTAQCTSCGEIHNLVYSVETFGRTLFYSKSGSIRGKTKHEGLSSHSGSLHLATKRYTSTKKHSGKTLHLKHYTTSSNFSKPCDMYKPSNEHCSAGSVKDTKWKADSQPNCPGLLHTEGAPVSCLLTIWLRSLSWTDFMSFLIRHIWKQQAKQQGFRGGNRQYDRVRTIRARVDTWDNKISKML